VPDVLGSDRRKLSKRHGDVALSMYREKGYLPETMFNFLSLLGWSLDDKTDVMTRQQVIDAFSLDRVSKTGGIFNVEKLDWMNGVYIRGLSLDDLTRRALPFLEKALERKLDPDFVLRVMPLVQERAKTLTELPALTRFFFVDELNFDPNLLVAKNMTPESTLHALEVSAARLRALPAFDEPSLELLLRPLAEELGLKAGQLFSVLRTAVTGEVATPPLFQTMVVLGKDRCIKRINTAIVNLRKISS